MSWKTEQNLEGANKVNDNMDKEGDLIIYEEQTDTKNKKRTNCPLNYPGDHPRQGMVIFYGWISTQTVIFQDIEKVFRCSTRILGAC
jgi:hypothetical protein